MNERQLDNWLVWVPWGLIGLRFVLGPIVILLTWANCPSACLIVAVVLAFVSDVYDGVLARRWGVVTDRLRRTDSAADVSFYLCVIVSLAIARPEIIAKYLLPLAGLIAAEALCQVINIARFQRYTATHAYLCKIWSVLLCIATIVTLCVGEIPLILNITIIFGFIAYADVLLIICLLPVPAVDIPSAYHAWRQRTSLVPASRS